MNYINLDITKELEDRGFNIFIKRSDKDNNNTCSIKRLKLLAISNDYIAFNSNISEL